MIKEAMDNMEQLEEIERQINEKLLDPDLDDVSRKNKLAELKTVAEIRSNYQVNENNRLNNYARNDIDERKVRVDEEKVKVDKARIRADVGKAAIYFFGGMFANFSSYLMEEAFQKFPPLTRLAEKLHDAMLRK